MTGDVRYVNGISVAVGLVADASDPKTSQSSPLMFIVCFRLLSLMKRDTFLDKDTLLSFIQLGVSVSVGDES